MTNEKTHFTSYMHVPIRRHRSNIDGGFGRVKMLLEQEAYLLNKLLIKSIYSKLPLENVMILSA